MDRRRPVIGAIVILFLAVLFAHAGAQPPTTSSIVINEVVTDPQIDWSTTDFDGTDGGGTISQGVDEWVELLINTAGLDLTDWTIELLDGSPVTGDLTNSGAFQVSRYVGTGSLANTQVGDRLVLGNVAGSGKMNNDIFIALKDATGIVVDDVEIGDAGRPGDGAPAPGEDGNATGPDDEAIARLPDGVDTDDDAADFAQQAATIGMSNGQLPTPTPSPTSAPAGSVMINEVVTDPQTDWSTTDFDGTDGSGTISQGVDEWVELLINKAGLDLTGWTIELLDTSPITGDLTSSSSGAFQVSRYIGTGSFTNTQAGDRLVLGNVAGSGKMNNDILILLKDVAGTVIDDVEIGDDLEGDGDDGAPEPNENGDATGQADEAIARVPDGTDTDNDINDFMKQPASLGIANPTPTPTATSTSSSTPTSTRTPTPTPTSTPTVTPTPSPTSTSTATPTPTPTPASPGSVLINEVVTDPQQDWNDSDGGNGVPFDATPGTGAITATDEWLELLNASGVAVNLSNWTLDMNDTTPATLKFSNPGSAVFEFSQGGSISNFKPGERLVIGNPPGVVNNDVFLVLRDAIGHLVDDVEIGGDFEGDGSDGAPAPGENGNATSPDDEAIARMPDGVDTDDDVADFVKQSASIGFSNDAAPPTRTPTPTATPTPTPTPAQKGAVVINEVVTDPQRDWNDTAGGDGIPFNGVPGSGKVTSTDEWVELLNTTGHSIDLTGWSLVMIDSTPATQVLGEGSAVLRFSTGRQPGSSFRAGSSDLEAGPEGGSLTDFRPGERLVIGNPKGAINNDVYVELRDASGHLVDDVEIGDDFEEDGSDGTPGAGQNGNALTIYDEAIARVPDGWDLNDDRADFEKRLATIGAHNGHPVERLAQLPILNATDGPAICDAFIDIQNVGATSTKAIILFWEGAGDCPPQCAGPSTITCTGLLKPGASWHLGYEQIPPDARAGAVFSAFGQTHPAFEDGEEEFADALCEALFDRVLGECGEYRRFRQAFDQGGEWDAGRGHPDFEFAAFPGQPIAVEVKRRCRSETDPWAVGAYNGIQARLLGRFDPQFGGFAYYAPLLYAGWRGSDSTLYVQNAGLSCTSVELWFRTEGECRRAQVCEIPAVAPGESYRLDVGDCVGPGWIGNVWIRSSQPAAIVAETAGRGVLMTYQAMPAELNFTLEENTRFRDQPADPLFSPGSQVNYGPLLYREHQGWDTRIQVQNLSSVLNAKVKAYFLDEGGDVIHTVVDWICPRGSRAFTLTAISHLPGNWVGQVRIESQDWFAPGGAAVASPNVVSVAQLVRWSGPAQVAPLAAMSYNLLSEEQVLDWQTCPEPCRRTGWRAGGLESGAGLIAVPLLLRNPVGPTGLVSHLAIQNAVTAPGSTDFVLLLNDQNGLLDFICEKLNARQVEYISLADWDYINPGFRGSAVISAVVWEHPVVDSASGGMERNLLGLAAVKVERLAAPALSTEELAADESSASVGVPLAGPFNPEPEFGFVDRRPVCPR